MRSAKCSTSDDTLTDQGDNSEIGPSSKNEDMPGFKTAEAAMRTILLNSQGVTVLRSFLPGNSLSMMLLRFANWVLRVGSTAPLGCNSGSQFPDSRVMVS